MRRPSRPFALLAVLLVSIVSRPAFAEDAPASLGGTRGAVVNAITDARDKILDLAQAMPEGKYGWRPGKGVRSAGEVYQHIAQANYLLPTMLGVKVPEGITLRGLDTAPMTKPQVIELVRKSYVHELEAIASVPESELADSVQFFAHKATKLDVLMAMATHNHEHLGQSIAYARSNGVVPPWTARAEAEQAAAAAAKKAGGK